MLLSFLYSFLFSLNACYLQFFGLRAGLGQLFLYKIPSVADVNLNPIKRGIMRLCPWWCLERQIFLFVPSPLPGGWHVHLRLLEACGATVQSEAHTIRNVSPSCVFPICLSCINTQDPTMWDESVVFLPHGLHILLPGPSCVWGWVAETCGHGGREQVVLWAASAWVCHLSWKGCPTWLWGGSLLTYHKSCDVTMLDVNLLSLILVVQCTLHKLQCPWRF